MQGCVLPIVCQVDQCRFKTMSGLGKKRSFSQAMDKPQASFTWNIENFSLSKNGALFSNVFIVDGYEWRILTYPKGDTGACLSVFLDAVNSATLAHDWSRQAWFELAVVNQIHDQSTIRKRSQHPHQFNAKQRASGFRMIPLSELNHPSKGYIVNDKCVIQANVWVMDEKKQHNASGSPLSVCQKTPSTGPVTLKTPTDGGSSDSSIPGQDREAEDPSSPIAIGDEIRDLFMDIDDLVDAVVFKPATSDQAREKLKALLALELGDVAERRGEIIGWASILASTSADMKNLLSDLLTTTVFESFLSTKLEAADMEQKLSKRRVLAEAFIEMPEALKRLQTEKQLADGDVSTHERIIKECEDEIENLQKKIAHHKEQLLEARWLAKESKETFQAEKDRAAKLKEELVATKDTATSWKEAHAEALAKAEELKREWSILVQKIIL